MVISDLIHAIQCGKHEQTECVGSKVPQFLLLFVICGTSIKSIEIFGKESFFVDENSLLKTFVRSLRTELDI